MKTVTLNGYFRKRSPMDIFENAVYPFGQRKRIFSETDVETTYLRMLNVEV